MAASQHSNELRLFVSSTFRDLQPEREQLVKKVFPRIRKECRARGVEFIEIDLRWGITEEESRTGKTIRICLEEIDRCRPYFIGIIGSRYGWVPGITEIEKDPEMLEHYPWLREFAEQEKSIIEMEFAHGAVLRKNDSAFFYEQQQNPLLFKERKQASELDALKHTIQSSGASYRQFASPEELGEQVLNDLLALLDRDFPVRQNLTPLEHERIEHEAYARNRRQSYVANPEYYDAFVKHLASDGPPLIFWGKSGLGKSALMAYLAHEYQSQNPNAFVIQHFIGAAEGSDPEDVMRQVMGEIKERYNLSEEIPSGDNTLREEFPVWLAKVGQNPRLEKAGEPEKLIILIDALNQLTGIAPEMHWLPDFIPANVRLVLSTTEGVPLDQLRKRQWQELELQPLTESDRKRIAEEFLDRYSKTLDAADLHLLAADPKSSSPLFLRTVLDELRIFGGHSALHDHLEDYLASKDERELFQKVLARMEHDHGAETVGSILTAIWASRHGLSESELMEITGMSRMALSQLMIAMEYHLMQREGYHTFFHNYLREAIELRYLPNDAARKAAHTKLAGYFSKREYSPRRRDEEPWQWREAGDLDALFRCFADPDLFTLFESEDQRYHFIAYLQSFERDRIFMLAAKLHSAMQSDDTFERRISLARVARIGGFYDAASEILAAVTTLADQALLDYKTSLDLKRELAQLFCEKHEYRQALPLSEEVVSIIEAKDGLCAELFDAMIDLSTVMNGIADYEGAERVIRGALTFGIVAPKARRLDAMQNLAVFILAQDRREEAIALHELTLSDSIKSQGKLHPASLAYSMNLSAALIFDKRYADALIILKDILPSIRNSLGEKHNWYFGCLESLSKIFLETGDYDQAERTIMELVTKSSQAQGLESERTILYQLGLGRVYFAKGDLPRAFAAYQTYLPALILLLGSEHPIVIRSIKTQRDIAAAIEQLE